jgi:peptidyl-prolyl cis-trans isomerase C
LILVLSLASSCSRPKDPAILTLGDQVVHRSDFEKHLQALESRRGSTVDPAVREALLESFLEERVLVMEARARGLLKPESSPGDEAAAVQNMLQKAVLSKLEVKDDDVTRYYEEHKDEFRTPERVTLHQILLTTEAEAQDALRRLQKDPKSFEALARTRSSSPEAAAGGLVGTFSRGELPSELDQAAFSIQVGTPQIVKTPLGYHVLKVDGREPARDPTPEGCRGRIREQLSREQSDQAVHQFVRELMARAKVNHEAADPTRRS